MKKIMIIDDEFDIAESIAEILMAEGYHAEPFAMVEKGLERLSQSGFDLVILDVMMPAMKGTDVVKLIRKEKKFMHLPVLLMSASREPENFENGWNKFIQKPFDIEDIILNVQALIK